MYVASELIGKPIISLYDCTLIGYISNILFCNKRNIMCFYEIYNNDEDIYYLLKPQKISYYGDCLVIKNKGLLEPKNNYELVTDNMFNLINNKVFSFDGLYLGIVKDVIINDNYTTKSILTNNTYYDSQKIIKLNNGLCLINNTTKKIRVLNFKPVNTIINKKDIDTPLTNPITILNTNPLIETPHKTVTNYEFLIGRRLQKHILINNGQILIKKNTQISLDCINLAKTYGKLYELTKYSK